MTPYGLDEWFLAMIEPTPTWRNFTFGQLYMWIWAKKYQVSDSEQYSNPSPTWPNFAFGQRFMWIEVNNDQIWLSMVSTSDFEQCSNRLQLDLISLLVHCSCEFGQIVTRYNSLYARRVILSNVRNNSQLDLISISFLLQFENVIHMCNDNWCI